MIQAIAPEIGLLLLAGIVLVLDIAWSKNPERRGKWLGWVTALGLSAIMVVAITIARPPDVGSLEWGGMVRFDQAGFVFRLIFLCGAAVTALFASQSEWLRHRGEFFALMLVSTLGMNLMASASDLILLFMAIETASLPLYVLAGFLIRDNRSVEAGLKYLLFGAITSAVMLYGFSLIYGFTGTTQLYQLDAAMQAAGIPNGLYALVMGLILTGFGFKISAAPFHFWAPDVYQGSPTPVAGFLSTASKAAGFAALLRVFQIAFSDQMAVWSILFAAIATLSMLAGNYLALAQRSMKRLLAYSSIAQAGYMLIGIAAGSPLGGVAVMYYLMAYLVTNLAAFGILALVEKTVGSDDLSALAGLSRRSPGLAFGLLAALLSLGGIPPFAGFLAKLLVFASAVEQGMVWLALVGIFNTVIGLYYYLNVLKIIYLNAPSSPDRIRLDTPAWKISLVICLAGILVLGFWFAPWYGLAEAAAGAIWIY
ncbi:MAG: NADH-quinone oxidoreductase subunit N [Chloroflexota bacterium]|jgi:NADH-quinone oxidoreductase subunit N